MDRVSCTGLYKAIVTQADCDSLHWVKKILKTHTTFIMFLFTVAVDLVIGLKELNLHRASS